MSQEVGAGVRRDVHRDSVVDIGRMGRKVMWFGCDVDECGIESEHKGSRGGGCNGGGRGG